MGFWTNVGELIRAVDIVVEVIDARMPELSRNRDAEVLIKKNRKKLVKVFNKIDLITDSSLKDLKKDYKDVFFVSVKTGRGMSEFRKGLRILAKRLDLENPKVGFVGYPNAGKSSLINLFIRKAKTVVSKKAGTTRGIQWVVFSNFKILDSPGVIPNSEWNEVRLALINAKNVGKLKNPEKVALGIIQLFLDKESEGLSQRYGVDIKGLKSWEILEEIGKSKGLLKKGGEIDENRTILMIINDWQQGRLKL